MIHTPKAWTTIFVTEFDNRSFVEMCLERSHPASLDVTMTVSDYGFPHPSCKCDKDILSRLVPNEAEPCERHFIFESLAESRHWKRINTLTIAFYSTRGGEQVPLALGSSRFFRIRSLQLTGLGWVNNRTSFANHLFPIQPFAPTLRSLSLQGSWDQLTKLNNLTSFTFQGKYDGIDAESFREFFLNNKSIETLSLACVWLQNHSNGPPVILSNLKSLTVYDCHDVSLALVHFPTLQRLSSLLISPADHEPGRFTLHTNGPGITFTTVDFIRSRVGDWKDFTKHCRPTIRHLRLENPEGLKLSDYCWGPDAVTALSWDVHTLEIGRGYGFWVDLKELWPELTTIRFEIPDTMEQLWEPGQEHEIWGGKILDYIEELVIYRSEHGRPFSAVERMVVSESGWVNRRMDLVWRRFYDDRCLDRYVLHG